MAEEPRAALDYADICDPDSFEPLTELRAPALLALAARVGPARLIDNVLLRPDGTVESRREGDSDDARSETTGERQPRGAGRDERGRVAGRGRGAGRDRRGGASLRLPLEEPPTRYPGRGRGHTPEQSFKCGHCKRFIGRAAERWPTAQPLPLLPLFAACG